MARPFVFAGLVLLLGAAAGCGRQTWSSGRLRAENQIDALAATLEGGDWVGARSLLSRRGGGLRVLLEGAEAMSAPSGPVPPEFRAIAQDLRTRRYETEDAERVTFRVRVTHDGAIEELPVYYYKTPGDEGVAVP